ncbi:hypothetical protein ACYOEI_38645 [Singulisphaera rosea]
MNGSTDQESRTREALESGNCLVGIVDLGNKPTSLGRSLAARPLLIADDDEPEEGSPLRFESTTAEPILVYLLGSRVPQAGDVLMATR